MPVRPGIRYDRRRRNGEWLKLATVKAVNGSTSFGGANPASCAIYDWQLGDILMVQQGNGLRSGDPA